jgi:hypothetical protein
MTRLLRTAAVVILYGLGWALFNLGCLCGRVSARLYVVDHPEQLLDDADADDDALFDGLDQIEREEPEQRRTIH